MDEEQAKNEGGESEERPDFDNAYANNTRFEASVFDLKLWFGQLEQHTGKSEVYWHTAVTIPWVQAKIMLYYLSMNVAYHEVEEGQIRINPRVIPAVPIPPTAEEMAADPNVVAFYEAAYKVHSEMFGRA